MPAFPYLCVLAGACAFTASALRRFEMDTPYSVALSTVPDGFSCRAVGMTKVALSGFAVGDIIIECEGFRSCSPKRIVVTRHSEALHNVAEAQANAGAEELLNQMPQVLKEDGAGALAQQLAMKIAKRRAYNAAKAVDPKDAIKVGRATTQAVLSAAQAVVSQKPAEAKEYAKTSVLTNPIFSDARLTPKGRDMVTGIGRVGIKQIFAGATPDLVVISPLSRTLETGILLYSQEGPKETHLGEVPSIASDLVVERQSKDKHADQRKRMRQLIDKVKGITKLRDWDVNLGSELLGTCPMCEMLKGTRVRVNRPGFPGDLLVDETNTDMKMRGRLFVHTILPSPARLVHVVSHKGFIREMAAFLTEGRVNQQIYKLRSRFSRKVNREKPFELGNAESLGFQIKCKA